MIASASEWAAQQWAHVDLGDQRRTRRALDIGTKMAAQPEASLPNQMGSRAALRGAYRLLNQPAVSLAALLTPHWQATLQAAGQAPLVLMVEDTTELDYTAHPHTRGLGPIGDGRGQGLLLHSTLAVLPDTRSVLGLAHAQVVLRTPTPASRPHWTRSAEGRVWQVSAQAVGRPPAGVVWVHVSDRGSDDFEYLAECRSLDKDFVVRVCHNRALAWGADDPQATQPDARRLVDLCPQPARASGQRLSSERAGHSQPARPRGTAGAGLGGRAGAGPDPSPTLGPEPASSERVGRAGLGGRPAAGGRTHRVDSAHLAAGGTGGRGPPHHRLVYLPLVV